MSFMDRFEQTLQKGLDASKDLFERAKDKAKDLGDIGILKFEIRQLESQVENILGQLGTRVFKIFTEEKADSMKPDNEDIKTLLTEIEDIKKRIETKEKQVKDIREKK